jgi:hypothetical protein
MAAQFSDGRLRRRRRSRRYRPCLVRMAVSARAHLGSRRANPAAARTDRHMNSLQKPDSPALFLESGKGHAARWPLADIDDRWRTGWGSPRAFGVIAGYLPSAILILPKPVSRSPPKTSSIYPSSISRALCSAGMRCIKPLAPSRNETNSSRVNAGADKTWAIARLCAYGWPVQANQPATIKPTHYLDDEGLASFAQKKRPQRGAELRPWRLGSFVPVCPGTILKLTHWSEIRSFANVIGRPADKMRSFRVCLYPKPRAAQRDP